MIDFTLSDTQARIVDTARDFGRNVLEPAETGAIAEDQENAGGPREAVSKRNASDVEVRP